MNYYEEEEQYMAEMTDAQMEDEYNRQMTHEAEIERLNEEDRINSCKNEKCTNE